MWREGGVPNLMPDSLHGSGHPALPSLQPGSTNLGDGVRSPGWVGGRTSTVRQPPNTQAGSDWTGTPASILFLLEKEAQLEAKSSVQEETGPADPEPGPGVGSLLRILTHTHRERHKHTAAEDCLARDHISAHGKRMSCDRAAGQLIKTERPSTSVTPTGS